MTELASILQGVFDRVLSIFQVFDLSFFISGGASLLAVLYAIHGLGAALPTDLDALGIAVLCLAAYLAGLVCFGVGRRVRRRLRGPWGSGHSDLGTDVALGLQRAGLADDPRFIPFFDGLGDVATDLEKQPERSRAFAQLYTRLWAEVRQRADLDPSFKLLQSFWVRAAVYDGLTVAIATWIVALWLVAMARFGATAGPAHWWMAPAGVTVLAMLAIWSSWTEAVKTDQYQLTELAGTLAWDRASRGEKRAHAAELVARAASDRTLSDLLHAIVSPRVLGVAREATKQARDRWAGEVVGRAVRACRSDDPTVADPPDTDSLRRIAADTLDAADRARLDAAGTAAAYGTLRRAALIAITTQARPEDTSEDAWTLWVSTAVAEADAALEDFTLLAERAAEDPALLAALTTVDRDAAVTAVRAEIARGS